MKQGLYLVVDIPTPMELNEAESMFSAKMGVIRTSTLRAARKLHLQGIRDKIYPAASVLVPFKIKEQS